MKSCFLVLLVVVCVAVAERENCFKDGEFDKYYTEETFKRTATLFKICKGKKADMSGDELKKCVIEEWQAALKGCEGDDKKEKEECADKKLGIEKTEFKIAEYKAKILAMALPNKKKTVETAITTCGEEEVEEQRLCAMKNMITACPDVKAVIVKLSAYLKKKKS